MPGVRKRYTMKEKVEVVDWHRQHGGNYSATEREFSISRKQIRMWDRDYEKLLPHSKGKDKGKKSLCIGAAPTSMELDNNVFEWFVEERVNGRVVTNYMLQAKAREIAAQLRVNGFLASNGWLNRWKKRFSVGIRRGTNDAQKLPSDYREKP